MQAILHDLCSFSEEGWASSCWDATPHVACCPGIHLHCDRRHGMALRFVGVHGDDDDDNDDDDDDGCDVDDHAELCHNICRRMMLEQLHKCASTSPSPSPNHNYTTTMTTSTRTTASTTNTTNPCATSTTTTTITTAATTTTQTFATATTTTKTATTTTTLKPKPSLSPAFAATAARV